MAKKKKNSGKLFYLISLVLGLVSVCLMFVKSINRVLISGDSKAIDSTYTGLNAVFGYKTETLLGTAEYLKFSFLNLLAYLFVLAGIILVAVNLLNKKSNKLLNYVAVAVFVVGGIMLFLMPSFVVCVDGYVYSTAILTAKFELAIGAILSAILSIAAGCTILAKTLLKK